MIKNLFFLVFNIIIYITIEVHYMNKKLKNIIYIILVMIILIAGYVVLIFKGILPNPFLDTKDLECYRDDTNSTVNQGIESV